jgi:hypothetical protein
VPIPAAKQDSSAVTQAVGDAYFNSFGNINVTVPWRTPCARPEGGACTGANNLTGETCDLGLPFTIKVTNRRHVVGEVMGAVHIFWAFRGWIGVRGSRRCRIVTSSAWRGPRLGISIRIPLVWRLCVGKMGRGRHGYCEGNTLLL